VIVVGATIGAIVAVVNSGSSSNDSTPTPAPLPPGSTRSPTSQPVNPGNFVNCADDGGTVNHYKTFTNFYGSKICMYYPKQQCNTNENNQDSVLLADAKNSCLPNRLCTKEELRGKRYEDLACKKEFKNRKLWYGTECIEGDLKYRINVSPYCTANGCTDNDYVNPKTTDSVSVFDSNTDKAIAVCCEGDIGSNNVVDGCVK
jgi:hypothetical protein